MYAQSLGSLKFPSRTDVCSLCMGVSYTKRFSLGGIQLFLYKRLSQYVTRLESITNFQGVTDLLCLLTDVTYMEEIEHLPIIFNYCPVCVILFLIQGLHHCGACESTGAQHLPQVFQFLVLPAVMRDLVWPDNKVLDCFNQDPWMV